MTGRALEVFHLTKLHLSVTGDVPHGHHTQSLRGSNISTAARFLCKEPPTIDFIPAWGLCVHGNCAQRCFKTCGNRYLTLNLQRQQGHRVCNWKKT